MIKKLKKITLLDIKNNLAVILLFPALLGGLWQLLELSKMSISFIRFFSPTQLLPDGLLILFMLSILYLVMLVGVYFEKTNFKRKIINISTKKPLEFTHYNIQLIRSSKLAFVDNPLYNKNSIFFHLTRIIFGSLILLWLIFPLIQETFTFPLFIIFLLLFATLGKVILRSIIILLVLFVDAKADRIKRFFTDKPILQELALLPLQGSLGLFLLFLFLVLPFKVLNFFHQEYMLPESLKNLTHLSKLLNDNNYTSNKISYFNDKYIFIEHTTKEKNITIEIVKFDKLFSEK